MDQNFSDTIIPIIKANSNNNPAPLTCTVTKTYDDNHVDITTELGDLTYVPCIIGNAKENRGVVIFIDGDVNNPFAIINDTTAFEILNKLGFNQESADKFNFAIIKKETPEITYEELWILSNAYYDYDAKRFVKIDGTHTSFGIQIQANGTYPGEAELGYSDNVGINIWRQPKKSDVYKDTTNYDYTDFDNKNHIGAKRKSDNKWIEFAISSGWNNSFMVDSYGNMTIGGAGFEIDGNGMFPFTRLTHSIMTVDENTRYALVGILDNAYHSSSGCDTTNEYSWFIGLKTPLHDGTNTKDNENASFVVMYNDTSGTEGDHDLINSNWTVVFEVDKNGIVS